jgi:phenylacetate-CoA ligase
MAFLAKRRLYESLPLAVKRGVCLLPFAWVAGKAYRSVYTRGRWFDLASREELMDAQERKLGEVLQFAVNEVAAYRHLRGAVGRFKPREALQAFPLLDKDALQHDLGNYLPRGVDQIPHHEVSTGGTSGKQLKFYLDDVSPSIEMGFVHRFWNEMGYAPQRRKATFRGVMFTGLPNDTFWQYNPIYNEIQFSPFQMSEANLPAYVRELIRYRPEFLHGYPSAIDALAEYVTREQLSSEVPKITAAFLTSETCSQLQRERIERAFRTRVFSWYGHSERVIFGGECEKSTVYHHVPDYGVLEMIDDSGERCAEGERGELVGTGLNNRCMPLIRYRTGDYATRLESVCGCGRRWDRFADVEGRWKQDVIIGKRGTRISVTALNMHGPLFERVIRFQYFQEVPGDCILKVVAAPGFSEQDRVGIAAAYRGKVGEEVQLNVQVVDEIPLTGRGKLRMLDSRLVSGGRK